MINKLAELLENYNTSNYIGIGCTPLEAVNDKSGKLIIENSFEENYANEFKNRFCEKLDKIGGWELLKMKIYLGVSSILKEGF